MSFIEPSGESTLLQSALQTPPGSLYLHPHSTHAKRSGAKVVRATRPTRKFTEAQKATNKTAQKIRQEAQVLLAAELEELLTRQGEELEVLAEKHNKTVPYITKLIGTSKRLKKPYKVSLENAK